MGSNGVRNLDDNQGVDLPIDNNGDGVEYIVRIWTINRGQVELVRIATIWKVGLPIAQGRLMTRSMMARILGDIRVPHPLAQWVGELDYKEKWSNTLWRVFSVQGGRVKN